MTNKGRVLQYQFVHYFIFMSVNAWNLLMDVHTPHTDPHLVHNSVSNDVQFTLLSLELIQYFRM